MAASFTNYSNLPLPLFNAISNPTYVKKGDISVTTLVGSPLYNILKSNFDYEEDVMDSVWSMFGSSMHSWIEQSSGQHDHDKIVAIQTRLDYIYSVCKEMHAIYCPNMSGKEAHKVLLEKNKVYLFLWSDYERTKRELAPLKSRDPRWIPEESMLLEVLGKQLSGTFDLLDLGEELNYETLYDYKVTSVWKIIKGISKAVSIKDPSWFEDDMIDWKMQTNIYAYMLYKLKNIVVKKISVVAILKDFSKTELFRNKDYPRKQITIVNIPMLPFDEIELYINSRMTRHIQAQELFKKDGHINNIPICTEKERWATPKQWAVMKTGRKTAVALKLSDDAAKEKIVEEVSGGRGKVSDYFIEERVSTNRKCEEYCSVKLHCNFFKQNYLNK